MKLIKWITTIIRDPERDLDERLFVLFSALSEIAIFIVFLGDILIGEHIAEILTIAAALILNPSIVYFCVKVQKVETGARIISVLVSFIIMPVIFFFGGGPDGGGILWFTYCAVYIGVLLRGRMRDLMLVGLFASAVIEFALAWYYPNLVRAHSMGMYYLDSLFSIFAVGIFAYFMVWFQISMYREENARAMKETKKAENLNASQNAFFTNMSHEIRTPINTILGLNEMIIKEAVSEEVKEDAENIQASGKLLLALINDILDLSKLESGDMKLVPTEYQTLGMINEITVMLSPKAREKGLEFVVNISPEVPAALIGDEIRIRQILINVLNNAIKYTEKGRVLFSVGAGERNGKDIPVIFTVSDTGLGIRKEDMPSLFSTFRRVDEDKVHYIEGSGLGLSIVKQLTDIMGGKITVDSVYKKGSTFEIEIPQKIADERSITANASSFRTSSADGSDPHGSFEAPEARILIVDDNEANLMVEKKLLRETKIVVDEAISAREALAKTLNNTYDIILMDHLMPEMDGIECAKRIRQQIGGLCKEARIVALTANAGGNYKNLFRNAGFDGYLTKPVSGADLKKEIRRLLPDSLISTEEGKSFLLDEDRKKQPQGRKRAVMITTESVADLPKELLERYGVEIISHRVRTGKGCFRDGKEIDARGLLDYMKNETDPVETEAASVKEFEEFFANMLGKAETIVHITGSGKIGRTGYRAALEASESFDNVFVVDSGHLSSGQGMLAIEASRMAIKGLNAREIQEYMGILARKIHTSFAVDNLEYLTRSGMVNPFIGRFLNSLMAHPVLTMKDGKMRFYGVYFGSRERSRETYISREIEKMKKADNEVLLITYAGLAQEEVLQIRDLISKKVRFEKVLMVQASPAISANCGPGSFGLFYKEK